MPEHANPEHHKWSHPCHDRIERGAISGDCLNTGCVLSKALLRSAHFVAEARPETLGLRAATVTFDFVEVMARVRRVIAQVAPHDSIERYQDLGVEVMQGTARLISPCEVEVNDKWLAARNIALANGATPAVPGIPVHRTRTACIAAASLPGAPRSIPTATLSNCWRNSPAARSTVLRRCPSPEVTGASPRSG